MPPLGLILYPWDYHMLLYCMDLDVWYWVPVKLRYKDCWDILMEGCIVQTLSAFLSSAIWEQNLAYSQLMMLVNSLLHKVCQCMITRGFYRFPHSTIFFWQEQEEFVFFFHIFHEGIKMLFKLFLYFRITIKKELSMFK